MMLHIKTYEGYLDKYIPHEEIDWQEYLDLQTKSEEITEREVQKIKDKTKKLKRQLREPEVNTNGVLVRLLINQSHVRITKSEDDWWCLSNDWKFEYYKCDGLEGLFKLMDEYFSKTNEGYFDEPY